MREARRDELVSLQQQMGEEWAKTRVGQEVRNLYWIVIWGGRGPALLMQSAGLPSVQVLRGWLGESWAKRGVGRDVSGAGRSLGLSESLLWDNSCLHLVRRTRLAALTLVLRRYWYLAD